VADSTEQRDVRALLRALLARWENASWESLDELEAAEPRTEELEAPSGRRYRVKVWASWDMDPWESDFYVWAKVYGRSGWRGRFAYRDVVVRGGEGLPDVPPPSSRWVKDDGGKWRERSDGPG
jgi:hypothetical protein